MEGLDFNTLEIILSIIAVFCIIVVFLIRPLVIGEDFTEKFVGFLVGLITISVEIFIFLNVSLNFWLVYYVIRLLLSNKIEKMKNEFQ